MCCALWRSALFLLFFFLVSARVLSKLSRLPNPDNTIHFRDGVVSVGVMNKPRNSEALQGAARCIGNSFIGFRTGLASILLGLCTFESSRYETVLVESLMN